eukprot:SAG11_NODE_706_length_7651_cov_4.192399_2_plen_161_part_00
MSIAEGDVESRQSAAEIEAEAGGTDSYVGRPMDDGVTVPPLKAHSNADSQARGHVHYDGADNDASGDLVGGSVRHECARHAALRFLLSTIFSVHQRVYVVNAHSRSGLMSLVYEAITTASEVVADMMTVDQRQVGPNQIPLGNALDTRLPRIILVEYSII